MRQKPTEAVTYLSDDVHDFFAGDIVSKIFTKLRHSLCEFVIAIIHSKWRQAVHIVSWSVLLLRSNTVCLLGDKYENVKQFTVISTVIFTNYPLSLSWWKQLTFSLKYELEICSSLYCELALYPRM